MSFLAELRRRKVYQVAVVYTIVAWLTAQIVDVVNEPLSLPAWLDTAVIILLAAGFPVALLLAWAYDLTPEGIQRTDEVDAINVPPESNAALAAVAVFPFKNLTSSSPNGFLADAIPMELLSTLSRVSQLRIVSGQSSLSHSASESDLRQIAQDLDVQYLISGSVAQVGPKIRVTVELDDAVHDTLLWSETYDAESDDVLALQREIAESIVGAFGGERLRTEIKRASAVASTDLTAWQLVHKANRYLLDYSVDAVTEAIPLLEKAVELDPDYAVAHATLGLVTAERTLNCISENPARDRTIAVDAINRAEMLAPRDSVALRAAGAVHAYCGDYRRSVQILRRAVALAPYDLGAWGYFGWPLVASGDAEDLRELDEILDRLLRSGRNHPGYAYRLFHKSVAHACKDQCDDSLQWAEKSLAQQPRFALGWMHYANVLGRLQRREAALSAAERCKEISSSVNAKRYVEVMAVLSDNRDVIDRRTAGLFQAGLIRSVLDTDHTVE